jgi:hypothetical protein
MTQYLNEILHGRQRLGEVKKNLIRLVTSLYLHKNKEDNYFQTTYASGRVVKEFTDKRKKDEVTYGEN